jgi:hypothetical protein
MYLQIREGGSGIQIPPIEEEGGPQTGLPESGQFRIQTLKSPNCRSSFDPFCGLRKVMTVEVIGVEDGEMPRFWPRFGRRGRGFGTAGQKEEDHADFAA